MGFPHWLPSSSVQTQLTGTVAAPSVTGIEAWPGRLLGVMVEGPRMVAVAAVVAVVAAGVSERRLTLRGVVVVWKPINGTSMEGTADVWTMPFMLGSSSEVSMPYSSPLLASKPEEKTHLAGCICGV